MEKNEERKQAQRELTKFVIKIVAIKVAVNVGILLIAKKLNEKSDDNEEK